MRMALPFVRKDIEAGASQVVGWTYFIIRI